MADPQRPLHTCNSCGYQWHSRGSNYSLKCPSCSKKEHSSEWVSYGGDGSDGGDGGPIIAIVNGVMWGWFMWGAEQANGGAFSAIAQSGILLLFALIVRSCWSHQYKEWKPSTEDDSTCYFYTFFGVVLALYWIFCRIT